jgi:hypothetical protein
VDGQKQEDLKSKEKEFSDAQEAFFKRSEFPMIHSSSRQKSYRWIGYTIGLFSLIVLFSLLFSSFHLIQIDQKMTAFSDWINLHRLFFLLWHLFLMMVISFVWRKRLEARFAAFVLLILFFLLDFLVLGGFL